LKADGEWARRCWVSVCSAILGRGVMEEERGWRGFGCGLNGPEK
jgi:hypothetical protein